MSTVRDEVIESVQMLVNFLRHVDVFLDWVVKESGLIDEEIRPQFEDLTDDKHERIENAIRQLELIDSEDNRLYRDLQFYGLTDNSLKLKMSVGRKILSSIRASAVNLAGSSLKPAFEWINLVLGSLAKAIPILDGVDEYKKAVELMIEHRQNAPVPEGKVFYF